MDASEASTFNKAVDWYKGRGHWFSPPAVQFRQGKPTISIPEDFPETSETTTFPDIASIYDISARLKTPLATYYRDYIRSTLERLKSHGRKFGALIMEPTCLGAGGMVFVDPLFQSCLIEVVRASEDIFGDKSDATREPGGWQGLPVIYDEGERDC